MSGQEYDYAILFIGNPGTGKSTMLNCLAGEKLFKSGQSYGKGMTYQLEEKIYNGYKYIDTPGLSDHKLREEAGKAISTALKAGGKHKIVFFIRVENGRAVAEDVSTMKLVLDAAPEIGQNYGIIIPRITAGVAKGLTKKENWAEVYGGIFNDCKYELSYL